MEKEQLIGDQSCATTSYGSDHLLSPRIAQGASSHVCPFEGASAPPFEPMDNRTDEEKSTAHAGKKSLPGPLDQLPHEELSPHQRDWNILSVSEQEVKEALLQYAAGKRCYRTAPAKHMKIQNLTPLNTYRYRLETFTETRETHLASELYNGGFVDSCAVAPPPGPWEITVDPPPLFTDCEMHIPVPHSYSVENCPNCKGRGAIMCQSCKGTGKTTCSACGGTGTSWQEDSHICSFCSGTGDNRCFKRCSNGWLKCNRCNGSGILLFHTELTITWKNNVTEYVAEKTCGFPIYHLQEVTGKEIFSDENSSVFPIIGFVDPSIDEGSRACIAQHKMQFASENFHHVLKQKQIIELVPLTKVDYEWKGKFYSFYLFGSENKVYAKDYPAKCCCCVM